MMMHIFSRTLRGEVGWRGQGALDSEKRKTRRNSHEMGYQWGWGEMA
jgi:hypothetical protein